MPGPSLYGMQTIIQLTMERTLDEVSCFPQVLLKWLKVFFVDQPPLAKFLREELSISQNQRSSKISCPIGTGIARLMATKVKCLTHWNWPLTKIGILFSLKVQVNTHRHPLFILSIIFLSSTEAQEGTLFCNQTICT